MSNDWVALDFDKLLDARTAECVDCELEGKVDRWRHREAITESTEIVCPDCGEQRDAREYDLPTRTRRNQFNYRGQTFPIGILPDTFIGEQFSEVRGEIADYMDALLDDGQSSQTYGSTQGVTVSIQGSTARRNPNDNDDNGN